MQRSSVRIFALALSALLAFPSAASACTLAGLQYMVQFAPQSAKLSDDEAQKIATWFVDRRDGMGISEALAYSQSVKDEESTTVLSAERMQTIRRVLAPLNTGGVEIVYWDAPREERPHGPLAAVLDQILLSVQPACTKTKTCCLVPIQD